MANIDKSAARLVQYIGKQPKKGDRIANTGLEWTPGQVHEVSEAAAVKLCAYTDIWRDVTRHAQNKGATSTAGLDSINDETRQMNEVIEAIRKISGDKANFKANFKKDGTPKAAAVNRALGYDIDAATLTAAWQLYAATNGPVIPEGAGGDDDEGGAGGEGK